MLLPNSNEPVDSVKKATIQQQMHRLLQGEPIQYVLEEAYFDELRLRVTPDVLIPRPETEQLVHWAIELLPRQGRLLDIGTGSGCIPLAVKYHRPDVEVGGVDVSERALAVAAYNANQHQLAAHWWQADASALSTWPSWKPVEVLISNPPYITEKEAGQMAARVTRFEPSIALFVPDNDPLVFYRSLAEMAAHYLSDSGWLIVEIHERQSSAITRLWEKMGLDNITLKADYQGKPRMMAATCKKK